MKLQRLAQMAAWTVLLFSAAGCARKASVIQVSVPPRPAGQQDVIGLTVPPIDTVRIGIVGIGARGSGAVVRLAQVPGCRIVALCDLRPEAVQAGLDRLDRMAYPAPAAYSGQETSYEELCAREDVDLVYICTDWLHHVPVALCALENGKNAAIEVPAATSMNDIWALIDASERTRKHVIMLENCCYDFFELTALNMARQGVFGEVVHAEGSYLHNLDPHWKVYWNNWRLDFNRKNRGDVYPTHGIGPVCQALDIHRGDRMKTLVAMDTKSVNGAKHVRAVTGEEVADFRNGEQTSTLIRTENGKTILVEHDVMTPRPYSRMYQLVGTEGYAGKYPIRQICLRKEAAGPVDYENLQGEKVYEDEELDALLEQYRSPILTPELEEAARRVGGHGGMDFIMDYRLVYCLRNGLPLDMDVYDMAEWCCVGPLSALSMEAGSMPVEVPDFTRGAWKKLSGFSYAFAE